MKSLVIAGLLTLTSTVTAMEKSLCGVDDRSPSYDRKVGRLISQLTSSLGCTATMISDRCAVTAGHCAYSATYLEFNVPSSDGYGVAAHPGPEDIYKIKNTIDWENNNKGDDFMVFHLHKNEVTGKYPGDVQGHYPVSFEIQRVGTPIRITGYGKSDKPSLYGTQQTAAGYIYGSNRKLITHDVDTMQGNSGSAIINETTGEIIGVHTHGGCNYSLNKGTAIRLHKRFKNAIRECLELSK